MSPPCPPGPVAVLGAGVTGLAAAWHLRRAGLPVVLFEASGRFGGAVESVRDGGWLHETGPNSLLESPEETSGLIVDLGLGSRRLYAAPAAKHRYVLRRNRLEAMPASPGQFLRTRLFSWPAKLGLAAEMFRHRRRSGGDETVAEFTLRRLGREFLDYAVDPLVGGVYAGDPTQLSVRHAFPKLCNLESRYGSLIRGAIRSRNPSAGPRGRIFSFPDGLEELPRALAAPLRDSIRLDTRVLALRRQAREWQIVSQCGGEIRTEAFAGVICALPAAALARLRFEGLPHPDVLSGLEEIAHPPVASVFTGYRREDVDHPLDGFGMLVPRVESRKILGTLFSSTLFPGRAPAGHVALTTFVGGARQPELAGCNTGALIRLVQAELIALLGVRAAPVYAQVRRHPRAIPQYQIGYDRYLTACANAEAEALGLYIGGNCRDGVSLSACLASGQRLARAAAAGARAPAPASA